MLNGHCVWYFPSPVFSFCCGCRSESLHQEHQLPLKKSVSHSSVSSVVSAGNEQASSRFVQPSTAVTRSSLGAVEDEGFLRGGLRRSFTQPLTEQELCDADEKEGMSGVSIAERFVLRRW